MVRVDGKDKNLLVSRQKAEDRRLIEKCIISSQISAAKSGVKRRTVCQRMWEVGWRTHGLGDGTQLGATGGNDS